MADALEARAESKIHENTHRAPQPARTTRPKSHPSLVCMHGACWRRRMGAATSGGAHPNFYLFSCRGLMFFLPNGTRHQTPKIDPRESPPYAACMLTHCQRTQGCALRRWRLFGCARHALKTGLENRTPIECNLRFFKKNRSDGERDLDADRAAIRAYDACSRSYHDFRGGQPPGSALPNDILFFAKE